MIIYDLACEHQHRFEGWFKSEQDYKDQLSSEMLRCPVCESHTIKKIPSANFIASRSENSKIVPDQDLNASRQAEILNTLNNYILKNTEDVGKQFAEEARKIHYGEVEERGIRGQASVAEVKELNDEGIQVVPLLGPSHDKQKLN